MNPRHMTRHRTRRRKTENICTNMKIVGKSTSRTSKTSRARDWTAPVKDRRAQAAVKELNQIQVWPHWWSESTCLQRLEVSFSLWLRELAGGPDSTWESKFRAGCFDSRPTVSGWNWRCDAAFRWNGNKLKLWNQCWPLYLSHITWMHHELSVKHENIKH